MEQIKRIRVITVLTICMFLTFACSSGESGTRALTFEKTKIEMSAPIDENEDSPSCSIFIEIDGLADTTITAERINRTIIRHAFNEKRQMPMAAAADSFCQTYVRRYRSDLSRLYRADKANGVNSSWYDYRCRITSSHSEGLDGCLCYQLHKVRYEGGAREYEETVCMNFDPKTGGEISLDNLFRPVSQAVLPTLLTRKLLDKFECRTVAELREKGIRRLTETYIPSNYTLGKDGITFIYNADEIAPYETGAISLFVPYSDMEYLKKIPE